MIPESFIEQLKYSLTIEDFIGSYITLKRRGRNYNGLCPFHSEKTPSFTVYPESQSYYCFGCQNGGDIITFARNIENLEYIEALKLLAGRAGLTLPEDSVDDKAAKLKARVLEMNRIAARFFHDSLKSAQGKGALDYLLGRGITLKTIKKFGLGYSPDRWDSLRNHLRANGFSEDEMLSAALCTRGKSGGVYDSFRGRAMFPIIDLRGNVIGFGGRAMADGGPKYLNSGDTPVFKKSRNLFALNFAKGTKSDTLILCEGYMDVIAIHQAGFDNAVATLGTALTTEQARLIGQYTRKVLLSYDSDSAGQTATKRAINLLSEIDVAVSVLEIKGAKDPDEFIKRFGAQRFENLLHGGKGAMDFEIDQLKSRHDLEQPEGKAAFLKEFCILMAGIANPIIRDVYISQIARALDVSKDTVTVTVNSYRKKNRAAAEKKQTHNLKVYAQDNAENRPKQATVQGLEGLVAEQNLIALLLKNPDVYDNVKTQMSADDFCDEHNRLLYEAVAGALGEGILPEPIKLSAKLPPKLMSILTRLMATKREIPFYPGQENEFILAIKAQKDIKTTDEVKNMSPEEYMAYITSLAARKK